MVKATGSDRRACPTPRRQRASRSTALGERFSGRYFVTVDHPHHRRQRLHHPVRVPPRGVKGSCSASNGIVVGVVDDLDDPEGLGPRAGAASAPRRRAERLGAARLAPMRRQGPRHASSGPSATTRCWSRSSRATRGGPTSSAALWSKADPPPPDDGSAATTTGGYLARAAGHVLKLRRHARAPSGSRSSTRAASTRS